MINKNETKKIKELVEEFFKKMEVEAKVNILSFKDLTIPIEVKVEDPCYAIGQNGETLFEIQHLLKIILKRQVAENIYVDLDINNYKKKKIEYLKELAKSSADEAALSKKEITLPPMTPYERRIVHIELFQREDIITESVGVDPRRKVIIKPQPRS